MALHTPTFGVNIETRLSKMPGMNLGDTVPDFEAETSMGPIKFHEWMGDRCF